MIIRHKNRVDFLVAGLLIMMLLLPSYVTGAACPMARQSNSNSAAGSCCPVSENPGEQSGCDSQTENLSRKGSEHCEVDSSAHPSCEDCNCFFLPFSDNNASAAEALTTSHTFLNYSAESSTPLFTIRETILRINPEPDPVPSLVPIYLMNQVFLN